MKTTHYCSEDIVVWNNVIAKYGNIKHLIRQGDILSLADEKDKLAYKAANPKK